MQNRQSSRLSEARLQLFMAILVQNEGVFEQFKGQLTVEHFDMEWCRLLYRVVFDHYTYNSELPRFAELESGLKSYFEEDPDVISEGARDDLELFLDYAYLDASTFADDSVHSEKLEKFAFRSARIILMRFEKQKLVCYFLLRIFLFFQLYRQLIRYRMLQSNLLLICRYLTFFLLHVPHPCR